MDDKGKLGPYLNYATGKTEKPIAALVKLMPMEGRARKVIQNGITNSIFLHGASVVQNVLRQLNIGKSY